MNNATILIQVMLDALNRASVIGTLLAKAQSENRAVTDAELDAILADNAVIRKELQDAIDARKALG